METIKVKIFLGGRGTAGVRGRQVRLDRPPRRPGGDASGRGVPADPLGVAMELPAGYEAHIAPRSSTFKNYGILQTNGVGVVDQSYCGDGDQWHMPAYATRDVTIPRVPGSASSAFWRTSPA